MVHSVGIGLFFGVWASVYLLDAFLKTHEWTARLYQTLLNRTGASVSVAKIQWYTTCFNRFFMRMGQWRPRFLQIWFNCGVVFGLVAMVLSVWLLTLLVYNTLKRDKPVEQQVLTPVMPGVNLPMSQTTYYLLTLLVCGILHEMGHAVAAVREQVRVNGFGLFFLAIYPGAFVDLFTEHLQVISPIRQLRIYCAGVWHNFIIVILALLVLLVLPWVLMIAYSTGQSVVITAVTQNSAVSGPRGLTVGDQVTFISDCKVTSLLDWSACVSASLKERSLGHCMPLDLVKSQDISFHNFKTVNGNVECCNNRTNTHLCFSYYSRKSLKLKYSCLPARTTTDRHTCKLHSDCYNPKTEMSCVVPSLDNTTKLLRVYRKNRTPLLFLGHPLDLHYSLSLSNYVPRQSIISVKLPYVIETFCKYLISLSGALAILNVVPCYALDGQWILLAFIEYSLKDKVTDSETRGLIYTLILLFGTMLLTTNLFIAMWTLFR